MATLVFSTVGGVIGAAAGGPAGLAIGQSIGALGGGLIDRALFAPSERQTDPASSGDIHVQTSTEGSHILEAFGTIRTAGQIIWATPFEKHEGSSGQGKGGQSASSNSYYSTSLAIGLGRGTMDAVRRIWADGQPLDTSGVIWRFYNGAPDQEPDPLIERVEGFAPAYRGLAYVVFENLDLSPFGNRVPQFSFEITRYAEKIKDRIRAITMIPGATELGYHPDIHYRIGGSGSVFAENQNSDLGKTDWTAALDQLEEACPHCEAVSLVVAWFGTSLNIGTCKIKPKVIINVKNNYPRQWFVSGLSRGTADMVSFVNNRPAFGGTPSDHSVVAAIQDLKRRGFRVMFHPFIMMDIPMTGNSQRFPWRGHISAGSSKNPEAIQRKTNRFFGAAAVDSFSKRGDNIYFNGDSQDWGFRRFILHCAKLCEMAGGVDSFLLGSELGGVTRTYSSPGVYPAVSKLKDLAGDVKQVLPNAKLSYGANWDEYRGHDVAGLPDFYFHLDEFWADPSVDFVGINYYMPLADWRDGFPNKDLTDGRTSSIYDLNYLRQNISAGENYDWFYLNNDAHRNQQIRTPITDGSHNKPWVFRSKDISSWWSHAHYHRPNGVEASEPTQWQAGMKPIWFTETGCAAADKSANQPNVFIDISSVNSSDSGLPYFSSGARDDFMQNRYLEAILTGFDENHPDHLDDFNVKIGDVRMVSPENMFIWCWDARPYPYFPNNQDLWTDGVNWAQGHWITGRASYSSVANAVRNLLQDNDFTPYDTSDLRFSLKGFRIDRISTPRDALDTMMRFYFFDAVEHNGKIHFIHRDKEPVAVIRADQCVAGEDGQPGYQLIRAQETELPKAVKLLYIHEGENYHQAVAEARRLTGASRYIAQANLPIIASQAEALAAAQSWLHETLIARERAQLRLPPSSLALEPGDVITFIAADQRRRNMRITSIRDENVRIIEAVAVEPAVYRRSFVETDSNLLTAIAENVPLPPQSVAHQSAAPQTARVMLPERDPSMKSAAAAPAIYGPPYVEMMDLPHLRGDEKIAPHIAIYADPRPDRFAVYRSINGQYGWQNHAVISAQAVIGIIETPLNEGTETCWDEANHFRVRMLHGTLMSRSKQDVLLGANYAAIKHRQGWEIIQFRQADLVQGSDENKIYYNISGLLRARAGTDVEMRQPIHSDAAFVMLDPDQIVQLNFTPVERNVPYYWRIGASSQPYSSIAYQAFEYRYDGINLRPLSPVHLRAQRLDNGDIALNWIRRTRDVSNDGWGAQDIPLGEASEAYEVEIIKDDQAVRRFDVRQPQIIYAAAQQNQDFGASFNLNQKNQIRVRLYQISAVFGRGAPREEIVYV